MLSIAGVLYLCSFLICVGDGLVLICLVLVQVGVCVGLFCLYSCVLVWFRVCGLLC